MDNAETKARFTALLEMMKMIEQKLDKHRQDPKLTKDDICESMLLDLSYLKNACNDCIKKVEESEEQPC